MFITPFVLRPTFYPSACLVVLYWNTKRHDSSWKRLFCLKMSLVPQTSVRLILFVRFSFYCSTSTTSCITWRRMHLFCSHFKIMGPPHPSTIVDHFEAEEQNSSFCSVQLRRLFKMKSLRCHFEEMLPHTVAYLKFQSKCFSCLIFNNPRIVVKIIQCRRRRSSLPNALDNFFLGFNWNRTNFVYNNWKFIVLAFSNARCQ